MPAMSDAPLRGYKGHEWFWEPGDEDLIYPLDRLVDMYLKSAGRNSTLIIGITPDTTGLLPAPDTQRLAELGEEIEKRFGIPYVKPHGRAAQRGRFGKTLVETQYFASPAPISTIIIQEDITKGKRVRKYQVKGKKDRNWVVLAEGSCIGHKRIEVIEPITVSKVKLEILESIAKPKIKHFAAY